MSRSRQIAPAPETVLGLLLDRRPRNRARGHGDVAFRVRINAHAHHAVSERSSDGETLRRLIGASRRDSIGDPDPHDPTIPIETGIGRPRRNRAGIQGVGFRRPLGRRRMGRALAGLRLEPEAEGPALGQEVTRATHAGVKPAQERGERPGGSQDRPGPTESRRTETVAGGEP